MIKRLVLVLALGTGAAVALATPAAAEITGGCQATLAGEDVGPLSAGDVDDAIEVDAKDLVPVVVTSPSPIDSYQVKMEFAGFSWNVASDQTSGSTWQRDVKVADYSRFGVGLYKVKAVSSGAGVCTGEVLVRVTGKSPLTTPAGIAGAVLTVAGLAGVLLSARKGVTR